MIKSELVQRIAERNPHLYQRDVENVINAILDEIADALLAFCEDVRFCDLVQPSLPSQALVSAA